MRKVCLITGLSVVSLLVLGGAAGHAQIVAPVPYQQTIPWGNIVTAVIQEWIVPVIPILWMAIVTILSAIITKLFGPYAKQLIGYLNDNRVAAAAIRALNYGFGAIEGATTDKQLSVGEMNAVLNAAVAFALKNEPAFVHWAGTNIRAYIYAHMAPLDAVPPSAAAPQLGITISPSDGAPGAVAPKAA